MPLNDKENDELSEFLKKRNELFRNPTLEAAQEWWKKNGLQPWNRADVPLATVHKARLHWLEVTDAMIEESLAWLKANGYENTMHGAPPLTPERRDADRVSLGREPLGDK